jgi:glucosamine--fructose-6-phosphate aminotransferase (isomerizing)
LHGLVLIVDGGFPVIGLAALDEAEGPLAGVVDDLAAEGAAVFAATALVKKTLLCCRSFERAMR